MNIEARISGMWFAKLYGKRYRGVYPPYFYHSDLVVGLVNQVAVNVAQRRCPINRTFDVEVRVVYPDGTVVVLTQTLNVRKYRSAGTMVGLLGFAVDGQYRFRVRIREHGEDKVLHQRWYKRKSIPKRK